MTRIQNKKPVYLVVAMALIMAMAMGFTDLTMENEIDTLHEFGDLLEGVEAEILSIPTDTNPLTDTTDTMQTGNILSQIVFTEIFDEFENKFSKILVVSLRGN